ncbi:MAG TPA: hypothetical protein VJR58_06315 [Vineibacter sp.]|nr:hypothetical protein [Vineibacter sp.]
MPKTYTVDNTANAPAPKIDDIAPAAPRGRAIQLNRLRVLGGKSFAGAGKSDMVMFSSWSSIGTTGLGHCLGLCLVWNKVGETFEFGYCAHMSSVQGERFRERLDEIKYAAPHNPWVAVSFGSVGGWAQTLTTALTNLGIADNHIWIYQRAHGSTTFGVDRYGNFGEI